MTVPASSGHIEYIADGATYTFAYDFRIDSRDEIEVRIDDTPFENIGLTGIGVDEGGVIVTTDYYPPADSIVSIRRVQPLEQLLHIVPNAGISAVALEGRLDAIVKQIQFLREELSRRPAIVVGAPESQREMILPIEASKVLAINSDATGFELLDPTTATALVTDPALIDDHSGSLGQFQTQTDPGELGLESLSTSLAGEIERLRYAIYDVKHAGDPSITEWYPTPYIHGRYNVRGGGAIPDDTINASPAIQAQLDVIHTAGGGELFIPAGTYKCLTALRVYANTRIVGEGKRSAILHMVGTDGIYSTFPINSSTAANIQLENFGLHGTGGGVTGGYVDVGGTFVDLREVRVEGFRVGVIFDQTEVATIDCCEFVSQQDGGGGIWLVNGADHTVSALENFTNRITVSRCQINQGVLAYGIIDDGGVAHVFRDNNLNGGLQSIRVCGSQGLLIQGNELEASASTALTFQDTTLAGTSNGNILTPRGVLVAANTFGPTVGNMHIDCLLGITSLTLLSNFFGSDNLATPSRVRLTGLETLVALGNDFRGGTGNGGTYTGGATTSIIFDAEAGGIPMGLGPGLQLPSPTTTGIVTGLNLNAYQEGTFTPSFSAVGATFNYAADGQKGYYTRIGNVVSYHIYLELATSGNTLTAQAVVIEGLPFDAAAGLGRELTSGVGIWSLFDTAALSVFGRVVAGETKVRLYLTIAATDTAPLMAADDMSPTAGSFLHISGTYHVV